MSEQSYNTAYLSNEIELLEDIINAYDAMLLALGLVGQLPKAALGEFSHIRKMPGHNIAIEKASARARARKTEWIEAQDVDDAFDE